LFSAVYNWTNMAREQNVTSSTDDALASCFQLLSCKL